MQLTFVLVFDGVLTAMEDYRRHQEDAKANGALTRVLRGINKSSEKTSSGLCGRLLCSSENTDGGFQVDLCQMDETAQKSQSNMFKTAPGNVDFVTTAWKDVIVGDIVRIKAGEILPADVLFLTAVHEDPEENVVCFVKTAQLDGESNLKMKKAPHESVDYFSSPTNLVNFRGWVEASPPDPNFERFSGTLYWGNTPGAPEEHISLFESNLLLRGCELHNCECIYALVIYTGEESKIRVNAQKQRPSKLSSVDRAINRFIVRQLVLLFVLCLIGSVGFLLWQQANQSSAYYLELEDRATAAGVVLLQRFFTFFLLNAQLIPISLYVSMKLARQLQKFFIEFDEAMHHVDKRTLKLTNGAQGDYYAIDRSMDLNDECGQITHIFSDKTGTLTVNSFDFRKISVNGVSYGRGTTPIGVVRRRREGEDVTELEKLLEEQNKMEKSVPHVHFFDGSDDTGAGWEDILDDRKSSTNVGVDLTSTEEESVQVLSWLVQARQRAKTMNSLANVSKSISTLGSLYQDVEEIKKIVKRCYGSGVDFDAIRKQVNGDTFNPGDHISALLINEGTSQHLIEVHRLLLNLSLNHSVEIEIRKDHDGHVKETEFSASSPDEEAFVYMALTCGYEFKKRNRDIITVNVFGLVSPVTKLQYCLTRMS